METINSFEKVRSMSKEVDDGSCSGIRATTSEENASSSDVGSSCELNCAAAQALEEKAWSLVPSFFQGLVTQGRSILMQVCCEPNSLLTSAVQRAAGYEGAATRCSLWNSCDIGTKGWVAHGSSAD